MKYAHDEDGEQLAWSAAFGMGDAMLSKTYMQGMSDFLEALHDPQGEGALWRPAAVGDGHAAGAAALAMASDPWRREHYDCCRPFRRARRAWRRACRRCATCGASRYRRTRLSCRLERHGAGEPCCRP
jgi:hypothetical protein